MSIEVEKTRSFQQFCTLQGPLLAHQFGKVRMQGPNLVYPRHQAVQVLLAPRTPKRFRSFGSVFYWERFSVYLAWANMYIVPEVKGCFPRHEKRRLGSRSDTGEPVSRKEATEVEQDVLQVG